MTLYSPFTNSSEPCENEITIFSPCLSRPRYAGEGEEVGVKDKTYQGTTDSSIIGRTLVLWCLYFSFRLPDPYGVCISLFGQAFRLTQIYGLPWQLINLTRSLVSGDSNNNTFFLLRMNKLRDHQSKRLGTSIYIKIIYTKIKYLKILFLFWSPCRLKIFLTLSFICFNSKSSHILFMSLLKF